MFELFESLPGRLVQRQHVLLALLDVGDRACRKRDFQCLPQDLPDLVPAEVPEAGYGRLDLVWAPVFHRAGYASVHYLAVHEEDCLKRTIACLVEERKRVAGSIPDLVSLIHETKLPASLIDDAMHGVPRRPRQGPKGPAFGYLSMRASIDAVP